MDKKAIELSINFVVMLILALAMLGGSLYIVSQFFGKTLDITKKLDKMTESELESMVTRGEKTGIPFNNVDVRQGDSHGYGLLIMNVLGTGYNFTINMTPKDIAGCNASKDYWPPDSPAGNTPYPYQIVPVFHPGPYWIENNKHQKILLAFLVGKSTNKCQHVYDITVLYNDTMGNEHMYNRVEKILLNVV